MTAIAQTFRGFGRVTPGEWARSAAWALGIFLGLGTLTALWGHPFFIRMTPILAVDYASLTAEAVLLGLFLGIRKASCPSTGAPRGGGVGFLGVAFLLSTQIR